MNLELIKKDFKVVDMENDDYTAFIIVFEDKSTMHYTKTGGKSWNKLSPRTNGMFPYGYYIPKKDSEKDIREWSKVKKIKEIKVNPIFVETIK